MTAIKSFTYENFYLSNFAPYAVYYMGLDGETAEHVFQARKTLNPAEQNKILACETPALAKKAGRAARLRDDWELERDEPFESAALRDHGQDLVVQKDPVY